MNAVGISSLTDRVSLQRRVDTPEAEGGHVAAFVTMGGLWARVRAISARATSGSDARIAAASHSVVVRFRTDISPGDRFGWRGRWLTVVGTEDIEGRRAWLSCSCIETGVMG